MKPITTPIRIRLKTNLAEARLVEQSGDSDRGWELLADAHVLSQPWASWHIRVHAHMFMAGIRQHNLREIRGQAMRLMAAGPGSITGRYPTGNSGLSTMSATTPLPVRPDLAELLES